MLKFIDQALNINIFTQHKNFKIQNAEINNKVGLLIKSSIGKTAYSWKEKDYL